MSTVNLDRDGLCLKFDEFEPLYSRQWGVYIKGSLRNLDDDQSQVACE